ncbi:unnamed protein product [Brugia timori]|uniref:Uncharacterized protein n=1 Tax=Brugia timori TaxID=42155 RepID=A0A3P7SIU2_9BILA|nr:unnamed protein product [Brugia timori]
MPEFPTHLSYFFVSLYLYRDLLFSVNCVNFHKANCFVNDVVWSAILCHDLYLDIFLSPDPYLGHRDVVLKPWGVRPGSPSIPSSTAIVIIFSTVT